MSKVFKILFVYPNCTMLTPPSIAIGIFTALLKGEGFSVDLFHTTLYPELDQRSMDDVKQENLQVKAFDFGSRGVQLKTSSPRDDLREKIKEFSPDLILISILETSYNKSVDLLDVVAEFNVPVIAGGVFPTFAPDIVFEHPSVTMICIGEGERAVVEVCKRLARGEDVSTVENIHFRKKNGEIVRNSLGPLIDINHLPVPDYSLFEPECFFRPMAGTVYKTIPVETTRGCPYTCTFCNSPSMAKMYRDCGVVFFRAKKMDALCAEIRALVNEWDAEYVYFASDNFLIGSDEEFDSFIDFYRTIKLPFWMQTRSETVKKERIQKLKNVGCHRMSMGLEHGNAEFRKNVLKKRFDNDVMIRAAGIIADVGLPLTVNNMIGFPGETRDLIFDTIELNRQLKTETVNCTVFTPFHGTFLYQECVDKGYISDDRIMGSPIRDVSLDMPQLSQEEVSGLHRTFVLYVRMPKEYWPRLKIAEKFDAQGNREFQELRQIYMEKFVV